MSFNIPGARQGVGNHAVHQLPLFFVVVAIAGILPL